MRVIWLFLFVSIIVANAEATTCAQLCASAKSRLKTSAKDVEEHQHLWERRLNTKAEIIRYSGGLTATEGLLDYMANNERKSKMDESTRSSLMFIMAKCFPETYVNSEEVRLSGLVNTFWVARHTKISSSIFTCD